MSDSRHIPVLPEQVLQGLQPQPGQIIVDATLGGGGHARLIAQAIGPTGHLIGLDRDAAALERIQHGLLSQGQSPRLSLVHTNFEHLRKSLNDLHVQRVDAVLADLGFSSDQIESPERGLSFQREGPLDMRFDLTETLTAEDILVSWNERDLADLFWQLGEERHSRRIARKIVAVRDDHALRTTSQLAELVRSCVPRPPHGLDPATKVFQALRIAVNDELGSLRRLLATLPSCLKTGGLVAVISFHSLEDRIVKWTFRNRDQWEVVTKKPIEADESEVQRNPRARSAKLRIARLTAH